MDGNTIMMTVAAVLILISAALYFIATVFGNTKKKSSSNNESQNELLMELKKQNALIQSQMEKLEREIRVFSGKQENQAKSIIKYNKENARQLAVSERDTLMRVMQELKKAIENNGGPVVKEAPEAAPGMEEILPVDLFEVSGLPADEEEMASVQEESVMEVPSLDELIAPEMAAEPMMEDFFATEVPEVTETAEDLNLSELFVGMAEEEAAPVTEEPVTEAPFAAEVPEAAEPATEDLFAAEVPETLETPEFSDELDLSALFAEMEKEEMPIMAAEEPKQPSAPVADPMAGLGSDPNAMMTPEDIAKLLEAMG